MKIKRCILVAILVISMVFSFVPPASAETVAVASPEQIVLSLDEQSSNMNVIWCGPAAVGGEGVWYSTDPSLVGATSSAAVATASGSGYSYYSATMTELAEGTTYYYQVGSGANRSGIKSFVTKENSAGNFSFLFFGDVQPESGTIDETYDAWKGILDKSAAVNPQAAFAVMGGDIVDDGLDMTQWSSFLKRAESSFSRVPMFAVAGNHESNSTRGKPENYTSLFVLPENGPSNFEEEFYSYDYGNAHIVCLNSNIFLGEQRASGAMSEADFDRIKRWISADLGGSSKTWKIVIMHHPAYAVVNDETSSQVLTEWVPIFEDTGVSLILCGHQHIYMRTHPMFDREKDDTSGIVEIMGNSGSKQYASAAVSYSAKMIENVSQFQSISVGAYSLNVKSYNVSGTVIDETNVNRPQQSACGITTDYDTGAAAVGLSTASAASGTAITVSISNLAAGKTVSGITVTDKNGKTYAVSTVTANSKYKFVMPNRSVVVAVQFRSSGADASAPANYYTYSTRLTDNIAGVSVSSSDMQGENKIKAGATVTVNVTREQKAYGASLNSLDITGNPKVNTISSTEDSYGNTETARYTFIMPDTNVTISPKFSYNGLEVYGREGTTGSYSLMEAYSREELMDKAKSNIYYAGFDSMPAAVVGKATKYVTLKSLLEESGIALTKDSSILMTSIDRAENTYTYDELYGSDRYYYPNLDSNSSSGKKKIEPIIAIWGYQERVSKLEADGKSIDDMTADSMCAYRFAFGMTDDEFNREEIKVNEFLKWVKEIKVSGYKTAAEEPEPAGAVGGGGGFAVAEVAAETVVDSNGIARISPDAESMTSGIKDALASAEKNGGEPVVALVIDTEDKAKGISADVSGEIMKLLVKDHVGLSIKSKLGIITADEKSTENILAQCQGKKVSFSLMSMDEGALTGYTGAKLTKTGVEVTVESGGESISEFGQGKLNIAMGFTPEQGKKEKGYYPVWLKDDKSAVRIPGSIYSSGYITGETNHLSKFAVAYTDKTAANIFDDVSDSSWFADCVSYVTEKSYFQGTSDTMFSPSQNMTRAMFVTVLGRIRNINTAEYQKPIFTDVQQGKWYAPYVAWAYENKIVTGKNGTLFDPDGNITREEMAVMLARFYNQEGSEKGPDGSVDFTDNSAISSWAKDGVRKCVSSGIISGYADGSFKGRNTATRAEVASVIAKAGNLGN